jgi:hypothetical protein
MGVSSKRFQEGDVYLREDYFKVFFRYDSAAEKFYRKFMDNPGVEKEVHYSNGLLNEALQTGNEVTAEEYQAGRPGAPPGKPPNTEGDLDFSVATGTDLDVWVARFAFEEGQHPRDAAGRFATAGGGGGSVPLAPGPKLGRPVTRAPRYTKFRAPKEVKDLYPDTVKALRDTLLINDWDAPGEKGEQVRTNMADLALLPAPLLDTMRHNGLELIHIGGTDMTGLDSNFGLKNTRPRGWTHGSTWEDVAGAYSPENKAVCAGWVKDGMAGSVSVMLHEYGHAIGDVMKINDSPALIEHHKRLYKRLNSYLQQEGPGGLAGRQELLAEGVAVTVKFGREFAAGLYDEPFVEFVEGILKQEPLK